jgi:hypothetical protein
LINAGQITATSLDSDGSDLIINEFLAANGSGLTDEDGDHSDWIEIYNQGSQPVNLAGWSLTNDPSQPIKWPFPELTLGSHEYLIVFASGKNRATTTSGTALHANFKLSKDGTFLGLHNVLEGRFMDEVAPGFPPQFRDISYGRYGQASAFAYLAPPTPGVSNDVSQVWVGAVSPVSFSIAHGFHDSPLSVELSTKTPDAVIWYTTDGSEPAEANGLIFDEPILINNTTLLRAMAVKPEHLPAQARTQTYIFVDDVLAQPAAPNGFPQAWETRLIQDGGRIRVSPVEADYEMDPELVNDPQYRAEIKAALTAIPVLSLVMDPSSFEALYAQPDKRDRESEQPVSVEFIQPEGGLQVNAGLRLQGDVTQGDSSPKRSFRLSFRDEYGPTKLQYPLFLDSPVDAFDSLVLQAALAGRATTPEAATDLSAYARNEWIRSSQAAMSGLATHGSFVHLYLNGLYWGLYNLIERPDASFMAAYLGGDEDDWFIANEQGPLGSGENSRTSVLAYLFTALPAASASEQDPEPEVTSPDVFDAAAAYIDPAQLSDFIILNWYAAAQNWPESNWYAAVRLGDRPGSGKFLAGDLELDSDDRAGAQPSTADLLFEARLQDPDFRLLFADRLYKHLSNDGALTERTAQARWLAITEAIDATIVAEAARWGDASGSSPFSSEDWRQARDKELSKMERSATELVAVAREAGLYPALDPPVFGQNGGLVAAGFVLNITLPESSSAGTIYYTTDGSDPRLLISGTPAASAFVYNAPLVLADNLIIKARVFDGESWSALNEASFNVVAQDNKLRITEIMYNPAAGDDYEFIELRNTGRSDLELANVSFVEGIRFVFPPRTPALAAGEYAVLVRNPAAFAELYPEIVPSGVYDGSLSNKGERLILVDAERQIIVDVTYDDANSWPISPDGRGDSLVLVNNDGDPNNSKNWRASTNLYGSPSADD